MRRHLDEGVGASVLVLLPPSAPSLCSPVNWHRMQCRASSNNCQALRPGGVPSQAGRQCENQPVVTIIPAARLTLIPRSLDPKFDLYPNLANLTPDLIPQSSSWTKRDVDAIPQVDLGDRVLGGDGGGRLGWSSVYLRWHVSELDTYDYVRVTTATGFQVMPFPAAVDSCKPEQQGPQGGRLCAQGNGNSRTTQLDHG